MTDNVDTITYALSDPTFPAGTVVDHIEVSITPTGGASIVQDVKPDTATVTFANVAPGDYTVSVVAQDASGAALGTSVTTTFTIAAPTTVALNLPASVTAANA